MSETIESIDVTEARVLDDLGHPPKDRRARTAWVRQRFVELGCVWYGLAHGQHQRARELEDLAVDLLAEHRDVLPSLSTLRREVANTSFLPSTVDGLWLRAFPPSDADRARITSEWQMLEKTRLRIRALRQEGKAQEAEALRSAAVSYFNKQLDRDEVGEVLRRKAKIDLNKSG